MTVNRKFSKKDTQAIEMPQEIHTTPFSQSSSALEQGYLWVQSRLWLTDEDDLDRMKGYLHRFPVITVLIRTQMKGAMIDRDSLIYIIATV